MRNANNKITLQQLYRINLSKGKLFLKCSSPTYSLRRSNYQGVALNLSFKSITN